MANYSLFFWCCTHNCKYCACTKPIRVFTVPGITFLSTKSKCAAVKYWSWSFATLCQDGSFLPRLTNIHQVRTHCSMELGLFVIPRLRECCRKDNEEVVSKSRNKILAMSNWSGQVHQLGTIMTCSTTFTNFP